MSLARSLLSADSPDHEEMMLRLRTLLGAGITAYTDYSGVGCPREAVHYALLGLKEEFGWDFVSNFNFVRTCDVGALQTRVLTRVSKEQFNSQQCHFGALEERLPPAGQVWLKAAVPDPALP